MENSLTWEPTGPHETVRGKLATKIGIAITNAQLILLTATFETSSDIEYNIMLRNLRQEGGIPQRLEENSQGSIEIARNFISTLRAFEFLAAT